jgi:hypothetical protein
MEALSSLRGQEFPRVTEPPELFELLGFFDGGTTTFTPFDQTSFDPDFMQVYVNPAEIDVALSLGQVDPAFGAAAKTGNEIDRATPAPIRKIVNLRAIDMVAPLAY